MKRRFGVWTIAAAVVGLAVLCGESRAVVFVYDTLLSGPAEAPPNASPGTGIATVTYDSLLHTLRIQASFSGLTGTTSLAHIHAPSNSNTLPDPPNPTFGVATPMPAFAGFPLGVTAGSHDTLYDLTLASSWNAPYITNNGGTTASAEAKLALGLSQGRAYYNIHTTTFGGGEIRGFLQAVPEPATIGLAAGSAFALVIVGRRAKKA